jgi:hypothetical protein
MTEQHEQDKSAAIRELENGIFNMVVTLTRTVQRYSSSETAKTYVIHYLERLIEGLKMTQDQSGDQS